MGFLTIIFFILIFFYLLQWAVRVVLRWKINRIQRDMARNGGSAYSRGSGQRQRVPREGEVRVETRTAPGKKVNERIGDYVEYEEVEIVEESEEVR